MFLSALFAMLLSAQGAESIPYANDATTEYVTLSNQAEKYWQTSTAVAELQSHDILLVAGLMAPDALRKRIVLKELFQWLDSVGAHYSIVDIKPTGTAEENGEIIAQAIQASNTRPIIFSDSKGGVDVITGLVNHPEIYKKIGGHISIQGAYFGTPFIDWIDNDPRARAVVQKIFNYFGWDINGLKSVRTDFRQKYAQQHWQDFLNISKNVPTISFASWKNRTLFRDTLLAGARNRMLRMGFKNDGMVPMISEILPGSDFVAIEGVDHLTSIVDTKVIKFDRNKMNKTLFYMMFRRLH